MVYMNILEKLKWERLEVGVVSYGGCGSNTLAKYLHKNGVRVYSPTWHNQVCHYPEPLGFNGFTKFIYIHRNLKDAFISQYRRGKGYWDTNQHKLSPVSLNQPLSDRNLLCLMVGQYNRWSAKRHEPHILFLNFEDLFSKELPKILSEFLGRKIEGLVERRPTEGNDVGLSLDTQKLIYRIGDQDI